MDYERYRLECLWRNPGYQRDLAQLLEAYPGRSQGHFGRTKEDWIGPPGEKEALARFDEVRKTFEGKYPLVTFDYTFMVRQSAPIPLLHDPAWAVARSQALMEYRNSHNGQDPPSDAVVVDAIREHYGKMDAEWKTAVRCTPGHVVFEGARILVPIGSSTRLEDVRKLWPRIRQQQELCYGPKAARKVKREQKPSRRYEERLRVWDEFVVAKKPIRVIAKALGKSIWTAYRRYYEAAQDIDPGRLTALLTPEEMRAHVRSCATCTAAEKAGRSDRYCKWMQRRLGARSGRVSGAVSLERLVEDRREETEGLYTNPDGDEI